MSSNTSMPGAPLGFRTFYESGDHTDHTMSAFSQRFAALLVLPNSLVPPLPPGEELGVRVPERRDWGPSNVVDNPGSWYWKTHLRGQK